MFVLVTAKGESGAFNCFNCGEHGNTIDLVAAIENVLMPEAARRIAKWFDISDCAFSRKSKTKQKAVEKSANVTPESEYEETKETPPFALQH